MHILKLLCTFTIVLFYSFITQAQTLSHTGGYFTMYPFNSTYDDGSSARLFYDGNAKRINFWNSANGTNTGILAAGSQFYKTSIGIAKGSASNSHLRDSWLTGNMGPITWNESKARWQRGSGTYNDIGGILWQDEGTYFIRDIQGAKLEYTNDELLKKSFLFSDIRTGNIGIGTNTPQSKLDVKGRITAGEFGTLFSDWTYEANWGGSSNKWAGYIGFNAFRKNNDPKDVYKGSNPYTNKASFEGSNAGFRWLYRKKGNNDSKNPHTLNEYMRLSENGNLSIGTAKSDGYKLSVNGKVRATEVKVYTNWADYVFKEDYTLPTLKEVAQHIEEKGHLINIPSEEEVAENGIDLGSMNAKLLEKIEELTLYILEQEKRIKTLEIEVLKKNYD